MKEFQRQQEEAKLKLMQNEQENQRLAEEMEEQRLERIRLEKERREKKKQKEKERIQRKKEEGSYLTKEQREKLERARIQLEAAGIQVPARNTVQATSTNNGEQPVKKRVVYDDRRKKNQANAKRKFRHHAAQIEYRICGWYCLEGQNAEATTLTSRMAATPTEGEKNFLVKVRFDFHLFGDD